MAYPSSLDSLRTNLTGADDAAAVDHAGLHNAVDAAVMAVQAELGLDPSGAAATVKARLDAIDADSRWTDQRTPTDGSVTNAKVAANAAIAPSKIAGTAVVDNDARLTNSRTPTAHKASHATGGSDALSPADIGAATSAQGAKADTAVQPTLVDAKGDLLVGADADALMRLPAAADGRLLTTDGSQSVGVRWALPTTRVGTGSPLGIVTPDFVGQKWVDTAQTLGAREWVATGTTAASWVVSDGDTGQRVITATPAGWTSMQSIRVRRVGTLVTVTFYGTCDTSGLGVIVTLPSGFANSQPLAGVVGGVVNAITGAPVPTSSAYVGYSSGNVSVYRSAGLSIFGSVLFNTGDAWPTAALPGTPA